MRTTFTRHRSETAVTALIALAAGIVGLSTRGGAEQLGPKSLKLERIGRFQQPVHLAQPRGRESLLFVVERPGTVRVISEGRTQSKPFIDLRRSVRHRGKGGEQGLLSIAFAPDYPESGRFYLAYTDKRDALRIAEYRRAAGTELRADPRSARLLLRIVSPTTKHHGGSLAFGPDGYLYIGAGDGGPSGDPRNVAQSKRTLLGKLLRIDPRPPARPRKRKQRTKGKGDGKRSTKPLPYSIPPDNPFVGRPGRGEIYAYGLRNPWRFSFDRATGALTIADVGDQRFEEVNHLNLRKAKGANFGWSAYEGFAPLRGGVPRHRTVQPVLAYGHGPGCAVTGGYVVRDPRLSRIAGREIVGRYLFGDYCTGRLFAFRPRPGKAGRRRSFRFRIPLLTSFGEDRAGRIYLLSQKGPVYRLDPKRKGRKDD